MKLANVYCIHFCDNNIFIVLLSLDNTPDYIIMDNAKNNTNTFINNTDFSENQYLSKLKKKIFEEIFY